MYAILEATLLVSILIVILAGVLVPSLEFCCDDVYADELLPPFIRVLPQVPIVCHTAVAGTCELVDNHIDYCPIRYFNVGVQSINFLNVILY